MKADKLFLVLWLSSSLLAAGTAQAFCFSFGTGNNRSYSNYDYPLPAPGFVPRQYYPYPYSAMPINAWHGNGIPAIHPVPQGTDLYRQDWR